MRKIVKLSVIAILLIISSNSFYAQTIQIQLLNMGALDFAAFDFTSSRNTSPRILQILITPPGSEVVVDGIIAWKRNDSAGFEELFRFRTRKFLARSFSNDEINNSEIEIESTDFNSSLVTENVRIGKPNGVYRFTVRLFNASGVFLSENSQEIAFLNPTPPTIVLPTDGSSYDVGTIIAQWTPSLGATSYKILANYIDDNESNPEGALNAGNPLINNRDVGNVTTVNLRDYLDREIVADTNIVIVVKAVVSGPNGEEILNSPFVVFTTSSSTSSSAKTTNGHPDLIRLANLLPADISQDFKNKLMNGTIRPEQIQISDGAGNTISFTEFVSLLNYLEQNSQAILLVTFTPQ
jgi:hypothetical protein